MKVNYKYIFIFFSVIVIGLLRPAQASAQFENDPSAGEAKDITQPAEIPVDDKASFSDHDRSSRVRDSAALHTRNPGLAAGQKSKTSDQTKPSSNKEEDALSFNFLYYVIQKFKISDLVDD